MSSDDATSVHHSADGDGAVLQDASNAMVHLYKDQFGRVARRGCAATGPAMMRCCARWRTA